MMEKEGARSSANSMTSQPKSCYYAGCGETPMWIVASSVPQKNPDGSDLALLTCEEHYEVITGELRSAGTRYTLLPINGPHVVLQACGRPPVDEFDGSEEYRPKTRVGRILFSGVCIVVGVIIAPFIICYYAGRWILGYRPPFEGRQ